MKRPDRKTSAIGNERRVARLDSDDLVGLIREEAHAVRKAGLFSQADHAAALGQGEIPPAELEQAKDGFMQLLILALLTAQTALEERLQEPPARIARNGRTHVIVRDRLGRELHPLNEIVRHPAVTKHGQVVAIDRREPSSRVGMAILLSTTSLRRRQHDRTPLNSLQQFKSIAVRPNAHRPQNNMPNQSPCQNLTGCV